jgi:serine protease Do
VGKTSLQNSLLLVAFLLVRAFATFAQTPPQELVSQVKRAVVIVTTYDQYANPLQQGSGFFIASDRIVTNLHVVESAKEIRVKTFTGETVSAQSVVAKDRLADLAIFQISAPCRETTSLQVSEISSLQGESPLVVSNPKGSHWKVTAGQVAGTWNFEDVGSRMQITVSLVAGSGNGPVVNLQGHVIGTPVRDTGSVDDLDFAVPVDRLKILVARQ